MAIAGGEPLLYPHILEVVEFMSRQKIKPTILSNAEKLTLELAKELKKAGLAKIHLHIDSAQKRPGWEGKNELELNELRQHYADLLWNLGGIQCGYHVTVFRKTLPYLPGIVSWCKKNIHKVQHISFIAFRLMPRVDDICYLIDGEPVDLGEFAPALSDLDEITITTEEMFGIIRRGHPDFEPAAYLNGSSSPESLKYLITVYVGGSRMVYGVLGAKSIELVQVFYHLFKGRYLSFLRNPVVGKRLFALALLDRPLRRALTSFLQTSRHKPLDLFSRIYSQSVHLHQPNELLDGKINLCDSCLNMMVYKGRLINSCRLDEYRLFGGAIVPTRSTLPPAGSD
jgi:hypothetical protein